MKHLIAISDLEAVCGGARVTQCTEANPRGEQPQQYWTTGEGRGPTTVPNPRHSNYRPPPQDLHDVARHRANQWRRMFDME